MAQINQKLTVIVDALNTLQESIVLFNEYKKIFTESPNKKNEQLFMAMRDSMIQRFEYCVDLFWKVLKIYYFAGEVKKGASLDELPAGYEVMENKRTGLPMLRKKK